MKWTIENKILVPFVILVLVSQLVLLGTSFKNDYNLIISNQFESMDKSILQMERIMDRYVRDARGGMVTKLNLIEMISDVMDEDIAILESGAVIVNHTALSEEDILENINEDGIPFVHADTGRYLISHYAYAPLEWTFVITAEKERLLSSFYESYKYNLLTGIIFLTLSLQITVFIASNITNPVKRLVRFCTVKGERGARITLKRHDEIGQLGQAFNQMLDDLDASLVELTEMKKYNENILNSIEKGIITFDSRMEIISRNPYAEAILKRYASSVCHGRILIEALKEKATAYQDNEGVKDEILEFKSPFQTDSRYLDLTISVMHGESAEDRGYICSFSDVTERKKMELHFQRLERLATAGRLASGIAHEVRNPLTGMRTSVQVLKKRLQHEIETKNIAILDRIVSEIDRINKLVSELLGYTRSSVCEPENVHVGTLLGHTLDLLSVEIEQKGIQISARLEDPALTFYMDPNQLRQILLNLIKNAIDAVEPDTGRISIRGAWCPDGDGGTLVIEDNGKGIEPSHVERVFDPFYTTKNEGTGLGLSIVHELVQQNSGEIRFSSTPEVGTAVTLRFKAGSSV